jgi:predicted DNA-binding mobile mystery protein A
MLSIKKRQARRALDKHLGGYRPLLTTPMPAKGWLRAIREAIGMTGQQYASRLRVAWQSMDDLEKSEAAGTITINSLRRAAEALDCRLVYAVIPSADSLEQLVARRAREIALSALKRVNQTMLLEDQASSPESLEAQVADYIESQVRDADLWSGDAP